MRFVLLEQSEDGQYGYDVIYEILQGFKAVYPKTSVGYSANAGNFGGFVTDVQETYQLWLEYQTKFAKLEAEVESFKAQDWVSLELKNLVKWLYIETNGLDSTYELSHDFVKNLKNYLEPLERFLEVKNE